MSLEVDKRLKGPVTEPFSYDLHAHGRIVREESAGETLARFDRLKTRYASRLTSDPTLEEETDLATFDSFTKILHELAWQNPDKQFTYFEYPVAADTFEMLVLSSDEISGQLAVFFAYDTDANGENIRVKHDLFYATVPSGGLESEGEGKYSLSYLSLMLQPQIAHSPRQSIFKIIES